jgi:hypothetical protein
LRPKRLAILVGVLLALAVAAVAGILALLDPRALAASLAASVKAETGRELSLGAVEVKLLPRPSIVVKEARFGNATWGSQPWLAQAGRASADIDVLALFSRHLRIKHVELSDASVFLETDPKGNGNWLMGSASANAPAWVEALQIDGLTLKAVAFAYRDGATGKATSAELETLQIDASARPAPMRVSLRGTFAGKQVELSGAVGALRALLADAPAYPVDLEGKVGAAVVGLRGTLDHPRTLGGLRLALRVQTTDFADLAALFGARLPPRKPFRGEAQLTGAAAAPALSAINATYGGGDAPEVRLRGAVGNLRAASGVDLNLTASATRWWRFAAAKSGPRLPPFRASARLRDAPQGFRLEDLELTIAESKVNASLQLSRGGPRPRISGKVIAPLIDLARLPPESGAKPAPAAAAGSSRKADHWKLADADLDVQIGRLVFPGGRELQSGSGRLALQDGELKASALQATVGGAKATLDGSVADPQHLAGLDLGIALQGGELAELFKYFGKSIRPVGSYQGRARMQGTLDALRLADIDVRAGKPGQRVQITGQIEDVVSNRGVQLAMALNIGDSAVAGNLLGIDLPRLPAMRATARIVEAPGGYAFEDLKLALGRTSMQGRVAHAAGEPRPRITADLTGPLVDLSEFPRTQPKTGGANPLLAADVEAKIRFAKVVLPDRRALGPVSGGVRLAAGALELQQVTVAVDGASATLDGRIGDPLKPAALDLTVNAKVAHAAGLEALAGHRMPGIPVFTASGKLTDLPNGYALSRLKFEHAATTLAGDIAVTRGAKRFRVSAKGTSPLLDLSSLRSSPNTETATKPRASTEPSAAKPKRADARAIPDLPLPLNILRLIDADLDLRFDAVKVREGAPLGALTAKAAIADGRLKAEPVQLLVQADQALLLMAAIDAAQSAWAVRVEGKGIDFGELVVRLGGAGVVTGGKTDVGIQLQGRGKSLSEILASLDGHARIAVGSLRVHNVAINVEGGLVLSLFALANPFQKTDPDTDVRCFAVSVPVRNGVLTSERNIALETAKYNAIASGTVNLRTERIDMAVTPVVRSEAGTIVRVSGLLAAPSVGLDVAGAARSAASLGAAVVAPAWLIADALIKKAVSDPNPCATALAADVPSRQTQ